MSNTGLVYVFTGDGKGKTSAALGTAVRAVGAGMKVGWVAFYKQESWGLSDAQVGSLVKGMTMHFMGKGFHIEKTKDVTVAHGVKMAPLKGEGNVVDTATDAEHKKAAQQALSLGETLLGMVDVLVLDEVNNAVADHLIEVTALVDIVNKRKGTHVVLTGRNAPPEIVACADLVTEMKKVKHPYDEGKLAVKGLDF